MKANDLFFVNSTVLKAPMGGNVAAFTDQAAAENFAGTNQGTLLSWEAVEKNLLK